jgi:NAD(P)H-nitrite reductase large subunit
VVRTQGRARATDTKVDSIAQTTVVSAATLDSGATLSATWIVSATGVNPNIGFAKGSGIACDQASWSTLECRPTLPAFYAAATWQSPEFPSGQRVVNAIQPVAADEARIAAANMSGSSALPCRQHADERPRYAGLIASSFGQWPAPSSEGGAFVERRDDGKFKYIRLEFRDDILIGATTLGVTDQVGVIRGLIQGRVRLGKWKQVLLEDPTRLMDAYLARVQRAS